MDKPTDPIMWIFFVVCQIMNLFNFKLFKHFKLSTVAGLALRASLLLIIAHSVWTGEMVMSLSIRNGQIRKW